MQPARPRNALGVFVIAITAIGTLSLLVGMASWESKEPFEFCVLVLMALIATGLRIDAPHIAGTMSLDFVFILMSLPRLGLSELMFLACAASATQLLVHPLAGRAKVPPLFHIASSASAVFLGYLVYHSGGISAKLGWFVALLLASVPLFVMNTFPVAAAIALTERRKLTGMWRECNFGQLPYYLAGACLAALFHIARSSLGAHAALTLLPAAFAIYCSYHLYLRRLAFEKSKAEGLAALHMRTLEALAAAIEAKDLTEHLHLRRLQLYCVEIGREMGLDQTALDALRAAAVLHDVGKLAVPEHILSKSGKLTREEFEKVKIHPVVGAEILKRASFPDPVGRIVRHHHEKWNGGGYPDGLRGEAIPLGARILAVADALDAMISERPYRAAVPIETAISRIRAESGISYDPTVVAAIQRRYRELEAILERDQPPASVPSGLSHLASALRNDESGSAESDKPAFLDTIAAARQEAQTMLELEQMLGKSLRLDDTLPALAAGLKRLVGFDTFVVYAVQDDRLIPRYASGEGATVLKSKSIAFGAGLCGWVAEQKKPILNGNPSFEMDAGEGSPRGLAVLNSALVVPLTAAEGTVGTLMICRKGFTSFDQDHLRVLQAVSAKLGSVIENAQKYEQAAASASTDFLTSLPNARALFLQLESEMARCRRMGGSLTVMVADLDGFKQVNDRFGHLQGNAVLRAIAGELRQACRGYDYVARMGGDEFVFLFPQLKQEDVAAKVAQLNAVTVAAGQSVCAESNLALSAGESWFPADGEDPERLLAIADQRMYQSKQARKQRQLRERPTGYDFELHEQ